MGAQTSRLSKEELEHIKTESVFSEALIDRLYKSFRKLDTDHSGTLSREEICSIPSVRVNPIRDRVIEVVDENKDNEIDFREFITSLHTFATPQGEEEKLKFAFQVYDVDGDGFISNRDLFKSLKIMVGENLTPLQLQQLVDISLREADADRDGKVSFEDFKQYVGSSDLVKNFRLPAADMDRSPA